MKRSYYDVLGITSDASAESIEWAYQLLLAHAAPSRGQAEVENEIKFAGHARGVLIDPARRAAYDAQLAEQAKRAVFLSAPDRYVPEALEHLDGWWRGRTAISLAVMVLGLVGIGAYAEHLAAAHRQAKDQQTAEAERQAEERAAREALLRRLASEFSGQQAPQERGGADQPSRSGEGSIR